MSKGTPIYRFFRQSLRIKVSLGVVLPLVLILSILSAIEYGRHRRVVLDSLSALASQAGSVIESNLRHAMLKSDFSEVQSILDSISENNDFRVIYLIDTSGKVIFAPYGRGTGTQLSNDKPDCQPCHRLDPAARPASVVVEADDGQRVFRSMYPINNAPECSVCHDPTQRLIGLLLIDIPVAPMESTVAAHLGENLIWWVSIILTTVIVVNLAMSRIVLRRLEGLAKALSSFGQEGLNLRVPTGDLDEIGQLANTFNDMSERIEAEAAQNRSLSEHLQRQSAQRGELLKQLITAQEDERKRVARELHDDLGQALSALAFQAEAIERLIPSDVDGAIDQLNQIRNLITETTESMYDLIMALRPSVLDELGLAAALRTHAGRFLEDSGIAFELRSDGFSGRLSPDIETALYRIFQEALNNVRRHSGAKNVRITFARDNGDFVGEIQDDGHGFALDSIGANGESPHGYGLLSMQERVAQCCGQLEVISRPGSGTIIRVRFPIEENCA